jgi:aryl-alcohol dehydrogenase-like predicted oxidoreductase
LALRGSSGCVQVSGYPIYPLVPNVHPLGLALNYGLDERGLSVALERGVNYLFWTRFRTGRTLPRLREALKRSREKVIVATGPTFGFFRGGVRRGCENALRTLGTDYLDVYQLFWLGVSSGMTGGVVEELLKLKEEGKVRAIGVSIHNRERAGKLAADSPLDLLMVRYNAAHPGAERDIFPFLAPRSSADHLPRNDAHRRRAIVAYTATSWRKLLKAPSGWSERAMTAAECYRFCLTDPNVDVVLSGPKNEAELLENLAAVERGPLNPTELEWVRRFGSAVHG